MVDAKITVPAVAIVSAGAGLTLGMFVGEVVTRLTGKTGWAKFGIKAIVKVALFGGLYVLSGKLSGMWSFACEIAGYSVAGSIIPDAVDAIVAGGVAATAEAVAVSVRTSMLKKKVAPQGAGVPSRGVEQVASSVF